MKWRKICPGKIFCGDHDISKEPLKIDEIQGDEELRSEQSEGAASEGSGFASPERSEPYKKKSRTKLYGEEEATKSTPQYAIFRGSLNHAFQKEIGE